MAVALLVEALAGCAARQAPPPRLEPGQLFAGPLINIRAPASPGWALLESGPKGLVFAREGASPGQSYVAQVLAFAVPSFGTPDEFLAMVKAGAEKDTSPQRFKNVSADFQLTTERAYPCVRARSSSEDTQAHIPRGTAMLPLHIRSLYCQHPVKRELGFQIGYSQRGGPPDPDLDAQAQSFIDGVQVSQP
jgi:hypothetical protein